MQSNQLRQTACNEQKGKIDKSLLTQTVKVKSHEITGKWIGGVKHRLNPSSQKKNYHCYSFHSIIRVIHTDCNEINKVVLV